jgi:hypothetical protein
MLTLNRITRKISALKFSMLFFINSLQQYTDTLHHTKTLVTYRLQRTNFVQHIFYAHFDLVRKLGTCHYTSCSFKLFNSNNQAFEPKPKLTYNPA